jgi:aspartyl/asparaginyl beta-hydroxylase (cupin superfamily)
MQSDPTRDLRRHYSSLIESLMASGDEPQARECAALAVRHGLWKDPWQRPVLFDPRLPQVPVYDDLSRFWFSSYLQQHFLTMREELLEVTRRTSAGFEAVDRHAPLVGAGGWNAAVFYEGGVRRAEACTAFPRTAAVVAGMPDAIACGGVVMLSWLAPGTHLVAHCGPTNSRLRVHFGLCVPDGASIRVGQRVVTWQEGQCLVFDDSFEHEVWNRASTPRVVLMFDIFHPNLPHEERRDAREQEAASFDVMVKGFMASHGIASVARDPISDALTVSPDEPTRRIMARYMKEHNASRVAMANGSLVIE